MYRNDSVHAEILATLTGHQVGTVESIGCIQMDLIEMLDNGAIYMMDIQNHRPSVVQ